MDYLQYLEPNLWVGEYGLVGFKPCYKWITFNTRNPNASLEKLIKF